MCTCASCKFTDEFDEDPAVHFADWPKGDRPPSSVYGRKKIPADKAYAAHWSHCGNGLNYAPLEQVKTRAKLDMKCTVHSGRPSAPATIRLPHTRLNQSGWQERMAALNAASINRED